MSLLLYTFFFYKQPSCSGSNVKNGVKQLAKQPAALKMLMQKLLVGL